jgi:hypothetical protein
MSESIKTKIAKLLLRSSPEKIREARERANSDVACGMPWSLRSSEPQSSDVSLALSDLKLLLAWAYAKGFNREEAEKIREKMEEEWSKERFDESFHKMLTS